jgi:hypothetical protein
MQYDDYEGWIDTKQLQTISESSFNQLSSEAIILNADLIEYITAPDNLLIPPLGSSVSFLHHNDINSANFNFEGTKTSGEKSKESFNSAFMYLNAPYLWGGKTPLVSIALVYTNGLQTQWISSVKRCFSAINTRRSLSFIEESEPGDLAFFDTKKEL